MGQGMVKKRETRQFEGAPMLPEEVIVGCCGTLVGNDIMTQPGP
jgi:hypothetical protein